VDTQAVEVVWTALNAALEGFIRRRVADEEAAADLLQEVYVRVHMHLDSLRDTNRLQSWVYQIARNVIHDYYRNLKPIAEMNEDVAEAQQSDEDREVAARLVDSVRSALDSLPETYREALRLTDYEGLSQAALAERLGLSPSGAKSRVQRGRKMMRDLLLACCHFEFDRRGKVIDYYPHCRCCSERSEDA
jgi:RNA polymerase sigma-70 factor (ECF subfamily)